MNGRTMLIWAVVGLVMTGAGGLVMMILRASGRLIPDWLTMVHGFLAAAALTLLLYAAAYHGLSSSAWVGLMLLGLAGAGGLYLNLEHQAQRRLLPFGIVVAHALSAIAGVILIAAGSLGD